jgi:hypothetical protein
VDDTDSSTISYLRALCPYRYKTSLHCLLLIFTNLLGHVTWLLFSTPCGRIIERSEVAEFTVHSIGVHVRACFRLIQKADSLVNLTSPSVAVSS